MRQGAVVAITGGVVAIGGWLLARRVETPTCPGGYSWDPTLGVCVEIPIPPTCPSGFTWDPDNAVCLQNPIIPTCPSGFTLDPVNGVCLQNPPCSTGYTPICVPVAPVIPPPPPAGSIVSVTIIPINVPTDTAYVLDWQDVNNVGWYPSPRVSLSEGVSVWFPQVKLPGRLRTYKQVPGNWAHSMDGPANWMVADGTTWVWNMANPLAAPQYVPPAQPLV